MFQIINLYTHFVNHLLVQVLKLMQNTISHIFFSSLYFKRGDFILPTPGYRILPLIVYYPAWKSTMQIVCSCVDRTYLPTCTIVPTYVDIKGFTLCVVLEFQTHYNYIDSRNATEFRPSGKMLCSTRTQYEYYNIRLYVL